MLKNIKISLKLWLLMAIFVVIQGIIVSIVIMNLNKMTDSVTRIIEVNLTREKEALKTTIADGKIMSSMRNILLIKNVEKRKEEFDRLQVYRNDYTTALGKLKKLSVEQKEVESLLASLDVDRNKLVSINNAIVQKALSQEQITEDILDKLLKESNPMFLELEKKILQTEKLISERTDFRFKEFLESAKNTQFFIIVITSGSILASALLFFLIIRSITAPIQIGLERVRDLSEGQGDLTRRVDIDTKDELGGLANYINKFIIKIQENISKIDNVTGEIKSNSKQLQTASENVSAGSDEMSRQSEMIASASLQVNQNLQVVSSSIEEMSISISEVAKKAADAASIAKDANNTAAQTEKIVKSLGDSAKEIGKVIDSITEIAAQTNLLALNAAIEAAGAGDAGKGFAVVASEVKELARQASVSSEEIKQKITGIQSNTEKTVAAISKITGIISKLSDISGAIASAVEEQSITSKEVAGNISQSSMAVNDVAKNISLISTASNDNAKDASNALKLSKDMQSIADRLNQIVKQFKY